ncbi:granulocyte-macrophage colony-stimulating factor receptor subunit alpha-like isoform X2 [Carettochelys insculpta]|uniref:granulocyte-macrophage colony-stimulating factor receptor subunit alpha-like isoform X2 n=1 Tax=Carettochelys insculpta TaxID=44489 RepID=UPI003EB711F6
MAATQAFTSMIWCVIFFPTWHAVFVYTELTPSFSPIANLTLNLGKLELTWDSSVTGIDYSCYMNASLRYIEKKVSDQTCIFEIHQGKPIHKGALFGVKGVYNHTLYTEEIRFTPQGMNGTSVENFSCVIYNISFMNCTWNVGRDAPEDTQYFLFLQYTREEDALPCPHYMRDALGRHIACSFQNVTIVSKNVYFLVNGSSKESEIQFYDKYIKLHEIEELPPPLNITVNCSEDRTQCIVQWERPQLSHLKGHKNDCFNYQIEIQNKKTDVRAPYYIFESYHRGKKYTLQIRAKGNACLISEEWGEWSEPIEFDDAVLEYPIILLLIALGVTLVALFLFFLCKRFCNFKKMFSPVPQPKKWFDEFQEPDKNIKELMALPPTKCETEEITTVEEIS